MSKQEKEFSTESHIMFDTYKYIKELQGRGFKEDQAESIVHIVSRGKEQDLANLATKEQVKALENKIIIVEKEIEHIKENMATKEDIANINTKIEAINTKIESVKFDLIKWLIPFLIGIIIAIVLK